MPFEHGISVTEQPTSVLAPVEISAAIPFVVGTAPVNMSKTTPAPVNVPVRVFSLAEAIDAFGFSDDWANYTLCEMIDSHFQQYQLAPLVLVNVLDPAVHKASIAAANIAAADGVAKINVEGIIIGSVVVKSPDGLTTYIKDIDYTSAFDDAGKVVITRKAAGAIAADVAELNVAYDRLDPAAVDAADIIGGLDAGTGTYTGLETIQQVFPRFGIVPGLILAPKYSSDPTVAAVMVAKAGNINGHFKSLALTDLPTSAATIDLYSEAPAWKTTNGYTSAAQVVAWPMVKLNGKQYHMSTQIAGLIGVTDADNDGLPFVSPSNKAMKANGAVLADGTEVFLGPDQAAYLNSQGIVTALNFIGGWKLWGNHTGAFPASTDPKDIFMPIRRMFDWMSNTIILTYWKNVDSATSKRLIETVTDSINIWLNGLQAAGALLGGRVEFLQSDNPPADLQAGKLKFHVSVAVPSPAQSIEFVLEYDPGYLQSLFAG